MDLRRAIFARRLARETTVKILISVDCPWRVNPLFMPVNVRCDRIPGGGVVDGERRRPASGDEAGGFLEEDGVAGGEALRLVVVAATEDADDGRGRGAGPGEDEGVAGAEAGVGQGEAAEAVAGVRIDAGVVEDEVGAEGGGRVEGVGEDLEVGAVAEAVRQRDSRGARRPCGPGSCARRAARG